MVAHRLSTIQSSDVIFAFKDGHIVESGTHDTLMKITSGVYQQLVESQTFKDDEPPAEEEAVDEVFEESGGKGGTSTGKKTSTKRRKSTTADAVATTTHQGNVSARTGVTRTGVTRRTRRRRPRPVTWTGRRTRCRLWEESAQTTLSSRRGLTTATPSRCLRPKTGKTGGTTSRYYWIRIL